MRRRQAKTARDAGMKRVTLRIPEQHAREIEWSVTHGPKGITAAAWIRAAIRQHESRRAGLRKKRAPTPPPDQNEARVTVRISAQDERRIRRRYMQAGETLTEWIRAAIRERVEAHRSARRRIEREFGVVFPDFRPRAAQQARQALDKQSHSQCR